MIDEKGNNIAVLILAAGSSSRMGTPKQLLPWKHKTLIEHVIQTSLKATTNVFAVLGANYESILNAIKDYPIQILKHKNWQDGLGSSIAFGVKHIKENFAAVLVLLVDQPLINNAHITTLIEAYISKKSKIITTQYNKQKEGVPAIFDKLYFDELCKLNQDFGAKEIIDDNETYSIEASNKILDIDTKSDYERLLEES